MALGFGTANGVDVTDRVVSAYGNLGAAPTTMTFAFWSYRSGNGGSSQGFMVHASDSKIQTDTTVYQWSPYWTITSGSFTWVRPTTNRWDHYVVTYDYSSTSNVPVVYENGSSVSVTTAATPDGSNAEWYRGLVFGNSFGGTRVWDGRMAECAYWDVILTAGEAAAVYKFGPPHVRPASLKEYIPMVRDITSFRQAAPTVTGTVVQNHPGRVIRHGGAQILQFPPIVPPITVSNYQRQTFGIKSFRQHGPR